MIKSNLNTALSKFGEDFEVVRQGENIDVKGKTGTSKRISNPWLAQFMKEAIFSADEIIYPGEIIHDKTNDIYYFVYTLQKQIIKTELVAQKINLLKINSSCNIQRLSASAGSFGGVKQEFTIVTSDIRCHLKQIDADLRTEKPALSETAEYLLYMQNIEDLQVLDRIVIANQNYQVEHIDRLTLEGLSEAQLSLDKR